MVLDLDRDGHVIGLEVLNFELQAGESAIRGIARSIRESDGGLSYSYDGDSDSFYLRIKTGRSIDQRSTQGCVFLDGAGEVVGLTATWLGR